MKAPKLRFTEFHDEWQSFTLGNLTELSDGTHFTPNYKPSGIPFWSVETITTNAPVKYISEEEYKEINKRCNPQKNDILITRISSGINSLGVPKLVEWDTPFSIYVSVGLIKSSKLFDSNFLVEYIKTSTYKREFLSKSLLTASPKKINMNNLATTLVKLPSLREQKKLGNFFSLLEKKIQLQQEKIDLLKEQKKGYIHKIFKQELRFKSADDKPYPKWDNLLLNQVASIKTGDKNVKDNVANGSYHFFDRSEDIKYLNEYSFNEEAIIYPGEGSRFLPRYFSGKYALHQRAYSIYNFKENIIPKFIYYQLLLKNRHFLKFAVGSTVPSLRMQAFNTCNLQIPCIEEQRVITDFLCSLDKNISLQEDKLTLLQSQKKYFMQQMFI
ncbi:restriction endonuclease subunit S [Bacillus sinesaloumensis]|uniref:restriction endonuclease subunit S n=1 Tax=Litchfieldia sinesaloumensis TaxID=1926280 RepID=UPI0009888834|nr:restriction endonuclease subunit S [Bacillus sinesaloumensis]